MKESHGYDDLQFAAKFIAELILLCCPNQKDYPKVFRPVHSGVGDYMGSGYAFVDAFNVLYDRYLDEVSEELYGMVKKEIDEIRNERREK